MSTTESSNQKLSLFALTAMVVGSMVGAGIFSLPATFGEATGPFGALIAWTIAGTGMLMLAFVFQTLSQRKPELDAGVYAYAKAGFGDYLGFLSALGYWTGCAIGNVTYFVLIKSTLGAFFPIFGEGNTIPAVLVSSVILWSVHMMILRGVKQAAAINMIATIAKIVPLIIFVVVVAFAFQQDLFMKDFWGGENHTLESIFRQVNSTMLVTVFVFLGIEGASVYSRFAKSRRDVGTATLLGFLGVLCLLVLVTILPYGILPRSELAELRAPSLAGVFESVVGPWGTIFISVGLIISVLGAYLSWSLLAAEVAFTAAKTESMPKFLAKENVNKVPSTALLWTNLLVQGFLVVTLFSEEAFTFALKLTSAMTLIPYFLVAAYALKIVLTKDTYLEKPDGIGGDLLRATLATIYTIFLLWASGLKFILLSAIIYAPGTILFFIAHRELKRPVFVKGEVLIFIVALMAAIYGIYSLSTGTITI
ncbi:MAG TPA: basic amino acid/polyamine antiporter [Bdellovibrionales bacterium]|nr:basic amino acid/polyamine antiporter [Bdellovibrionales bacterium]